MNKNLHIICLNVPYPADFGGVLDLFYKLPALQKLGVKIHLHCFEYGRGMQPELNKYCKQVYYYKRKKGLTAFSINLPYIVSSRDDNRLLDRLMKDDYPILMEGIHCTYLLKDDRFKDRKKVVRLHNTEHIYYHHLYKTSTSLLRKWYSLRESRQLFNYEKSIADKAFFLAVSLKDVDDYKSLGCNKIEFLPLFLPEWKVTGLKGTGSFCLYHGNLEISENEKAAIWLIEEVFDNLNLPLVIAGKNPGGKLKRLAAKTENVRLVENPNEEEMQDLIAKAQLHIIPSFNATGIKLKLINALYNGRHVLVNIASVEGTGLETVCHIGNDAKHIKNLIKKLFDQTFTNEEIATRKILLDGMFNNEANARKLVDIIWPEATKQEH